MTPMRTVEVDDEVFAIVQREAVPLVDSFNSALRRILGTVVGKGPPAFEASSVPGGQMCEIPPGTPQALRQILDVVRLVRSRGHTRREATRQVAAMLGVAPQTVIDKYTRQLGLTAAQFDRLLGAERRDELQMLLRGKFPEHGDTIDRDLGKKAHKEHLLDIADRLFGPEHGTELPIPRRGTGPERLPLDFTKFEQDP